MTVEGRMFIGARSVWGRGNVFRAVDPSTGEPIEPVFGGATPEDVDDACRLADAAAIPFADLALPERAALLDALADAIAASGDALIDRAVVETGLPRARLEGERARTVGQLRMFAGVARDGAFIERRVDPALPDRKPAPRPELHLRKIPLGPVAVFGASNFPLAFSVAGGDTASALAAGCPVVVKAHPAHPGTSEIVARIMHDVIRERGLPEGVFSMLFDAGIDVGKALVADPRIKAVGFTGSRAAGLALIAIAQGRVEPIPVYAEMSAINPVILLQGALDARAEQIAESFVGALTLGAGQFCTNPGLVLGVAGQGFDRFSAAVDEAIARSPAMTMLTPGIRAAYLRGTQQLDDHDGIASGAAGEAGTGQQVPARIYHCDADALLADSSLREEVFGATSLIVRCRDMAQLTDVLTVLGGQLTISLHLAEDDISSVLKLRPLVERKAGRLIANGFGTGVEVAHAMVHGGPYPATSDGRTTSVGSMAIDRFLRPVAYQDFPRSILASD